MLANGFCEPHRGHNGSCSSTFECDYRVQLQCLNNLCLCPTGKNYDATWTAGSPNGLCKPAGSYLDNCSNVAPCSASQNLYCELSYYGGANLTGACLCNSSWSYWDGITCSTKLSIGGHCSNNTQCIASQNLFCSNYSQSIGTCDCDKNSFWNQTCVSKRRYNDSCATAYECDDNRALMCQGSGGALFGKCDCFNTSFIWDSLYVNNRSYTCIPKLTLNGAPCFGDLECEDFNYLICTNGQCRCNISDYWDGARCQLKRTYLDPCATKNQCQDYNPIDLVCRMGPSSVLQCVCNPTAYWENCTQRCTTSKGVRTILYDG